MFTLAARDQRSIMVAIALNAMWLLSDLYMMARDTAWQVSFFWYLGLIAASVGLIRYWQASTPEVRFANETAQVWAFPSERVEHLIRRVSLAAIILFWLPISLCFVFVRERWIDDASLRALGALFLSQLVLFDFICQETHRSRLKSTS